MKCEGIQSSRANTGIRNAGHAWATWSPFMNKGPDCWMSKGLQQSLSHCVPWHSSGKAGNSWLGTIFWVKNWPQAELQAGAECLKSCAAENNVWVLDNKSWTWASNVPSSQEGRWHAGLHQHQCGHQDEDSNCPSIFSIGEVISHVLCPVLSPSLHWGAEACPEKDKGAGEGSEAHVLWKAAQLRLFSLGKRGLRDKIITLYSYLKRVCSHVGVHCQFMSSLWSTSIPKSFPPCCSQSVHTQPASVPEAAPPRMWHLALGLVKPHIFLWTYSFYLSRPLDGI